MIKRKFTLEVVMSLKKMSSILVVMLLTVAAAFAATPVTSTFTLNYRSDYQNIYEYQWGYPFPATIDGVQRGVLDAMLTGTYTNDDTWQAVAHQMGVGDAYADQFKTGAILMAWADAGLITGVEAQWAQWLVMNPAAQAGFDAATTDVNVQKHVDALVVLVPKLVRLYPARFYQQFVVYQGVGPDSFQGADSSGFVFIARAGE